MADAGSNPSTGDERENRDTDATSEKYTSSSTDGERPADVVDEMDSVPQDQEIDDPQVHESDSIETVPSKGPDEVYCTSCGDPIKEHAEICPHCGVRQVAGGSQQHEETRTQEADAQMDRQERADRPTEVTTTVTTEQGQSTIPEHRLYELQKIARKDITTVMVVSLLFTPAGYWMVGKKGLAIVNFFTLNYFLLGFIIVPLHTRKIIKDARIRLENSGHRW